MPSKAYIGRSSKEPKGSARQVRSVSRTIATWAHHILSFAVSPTPQGVAVAGGGLGGGIRSEEHTSELQSLMRISYAVFCLKKTKKGNRKDGNRRNKQASSRQIHQQQDTYAQRRTGRDHCAI